LLVGGWAGRNSRGRKRGERGNGKAEEMEIGPYRYFFFPHSEC